MCTEFKYRRIYSLFEEIKKAHDENGSDPSDDYQLLRDIIEDGTVVRGSNRIRAFIYNIPKLKEQYNSNEHHNFIEWVYHIYRLHHEKKSDDVPDCEADCDAHVHENPVHVQTKQHHLCTRRSFLLGGLIGGLVVHAMHTLCRPRSNQ